MKKLVIFLISFIFSMPAFAQDESSFTENFSLKRDSGANSDTFFNSNILCPDNHLFFTINKRHSRQHRSFQIFRLHTFSSRLPLFGNTAVEDGRQNWGDRYNLLYGQQEYINPEKKSESLAEGYLKRLAERSKRSRKIGGYIGLVGGGVLIALGASMTSKEPEDWFDISPLFGYYSIIMGAACVGGGILALAIPSRTERELKKVISISDLVQRERASHEALSLFAARGRRNRILSGILSASFSVASLVQAEESLEYIDAATWGALAVYSFFVKSPAERAFQDYLKERESKQRKELALRVGIMPHGGVKIGFVYSF